MHSQPLFEVRDPARLHELIRAHALGTLIIQTVAGPYVDHLPFALQPDGGRLGRLETHAARDNPFWSQLPDGVDCTVVFSGPNAYISPSWYPSRQLHGRVQPSWYYSVVHARGRLRQVRDAGALHAGVRRMTEYFERGRPEAWRVDEAPAHFTEALLAHIVGIEIEIDELVGKWQVGQQRNQADREGIAAALARADTPTEHQLAQTMLACAPRR